MRLFSVFLLILVLSGCTKNGFTVSERKSPEGMALVKVGYVSATNTAANFRIRVNETDVSNLITAPVAYPGGGLNIGGSTNSDYLQVTPGSNKFLFYVPASGTNVSLLNLFETTQTFEADKKHTLFITDTAAATTAVVVTDETQTPDSGLARIKFINLIPNAGGLDLYQDNTVIAKNIKYKQVSEYVNIPFSAASIYAIRSTDSSATSTAITTRNIVTANTRNYTFLSRGYLNTTSTTRIPNISAIINQ